MSKETDLDSLLFVLQHPVRREILRRMVGKEKISPRELSSALGASLENVSHHLRVLNDNDAVELVDQAPVRGSMQHFYRIDVDEPWALAVLDLKEDGGGSQDAA